VSNLFAYVQAEDSGLSALISAFFQRGLLTPLWDPLFTAMIGIGVGYAAAASRRRGAWAIGAGWVMAVVLHTAWDDSVRRGAGWETLIYVILLVFLGLLIVVMRMDRRRIVGLIGTTLPQFARPDTMTSEDLRMLGDMHERRLARQWARLHCGLSGGQIMADYQLAATELALARAKADRGVLDFNAFAEREHALLSLMAVARHAFTSRVPGGSELTPAPWAESGSVFTHRILPG